MKYYLLVSEGWFKLHKMWDMASFCKNLCDMAQLVFVWQLLEADANVICTQHVSGDLKERWGLSPQTAFMFCNAAFLSFEVFASHHILETVDFLVPQSSGLFSCVIPVFSKLNGE